MNPQSSILLLRKNLAENLRDWMPNNNDLVNKELGIFDRIVTRRDFIKGTSLATLYMLVKGCGSDNKGPTGPPSQWNEFEQEPVLVTTTEMEAVNQPANIIVDSDILTSMVTHNPLPALGSNDAEGVKDNAIMESFNPHTVSSDAITDYMYALTEDSDQPVTLIPNRNYGIAEHVHMLHDDTENVYSLEIYEKAHT